MTDRNTLINLFHLTINQRWTISLEINIVFYFLFLTVIKLPLLFDVNKWNFLARSLYIRLDFFSILFRKLFFNKPLRLTHCWITRMSWAKKKNEPAKRWSCLSRYISSVRGLQTTRVARFISWHVIHFAAPSEPRYSLPLLLFVFFFLPFVLAFLLPLRNYKLLRNCRQQSVSSKRRIMR